MSSLLRTHALWKETEGIDCHMFRFPNIYNVAIPSSTGDCSGTSTRERVSSQLSRPQRAVLAKP